MEHRYSRKKVAKITEPTGRSEEGWQDATELAVADAAKTIRGITGVEVRHFTGRVKGGKITEYRADIDIAYGVEREDQMKDARLHRPEYGATTRRKRMEPHAREPLLDCGD